MTTELLFDRTASETRPEFDSGSDPDNSDPSEAAIATIREEGERIKRREVEQLLRELDASGDFADERRAIEELADAIVDRLLAVPIASLRDAAADDRAIRTAITLFDPGLETRNGQARAGDGERVDVPEAGNGN